MSTLAEDVIAAKALRDKVYALEADIARKSQMRPITQKDEQIMRGYQARVDSILQLSGRRAPAWIPLEQPSEYRRRLLKPLQACSDAWGKADLSRVPEEIIDNIEEDLFKAARADARHPKNLSRGEFREIVRNDETTGHRTTEFFGGEDSHFVKQFSRIPRRAILRSWNEYEQIARDNARFYPPRSESNSRVRWS
jgi:hypothetical protein